MKSIFQNDAGQCNLFVYGYASKLYKDDERAKELDQGKHLIPWMGNKSLKIDRYDVRGYLGDLSQFEEEFDSSLSEEEQQIEKMCDIERYHALLTNEEEEEGYKEEDIKRQKQSLANGYHQVPFKYDSLSNMDVNVDCSEGDDGKDSLAKASIPSSASKLKEIIEKTAKCVAEHGRQMEIIIKTRQANNNKFNFLNRNSELNSYYESILTEFKNRQNLKAADRSNGDQTSQPVTRGTISNLVESAPQISATDERTTPGHHNCPYSMIVDNIKNSRVATDLMSLKSDDFVTGENEFTKQLDGKMLL